MRRIEIYDTTLRDGSQGEGISFSLEDKLSIARRLLDMGFDYVEGGYPHSNEKDSQFFARASLLPAGHGRIGAFGMTRRRGVRAEDDPGLRALVDSSAEVVTIVGKASDFHVTEVLRVTLEENVAMIAESVQFLREQGRRVIFDAEQFFDGCKANRGYAWRAALAAAEAGASLVVLCDTNGGCMPDDVFELTRATIGELPVPVGIHCHNDCDLAVANSLAAVEAGAVQVQGTINGIGERCGNADLIAVIANLAFKKPGYVLLRPESLPRLCELSRYVDELANLKSRSGQAFVGRSAFAHKAGMHAHAVARISRSYEHMAPELVGNDRRILLSELSGRSSILALTFKYRLELDRALVERILARVVALEHQGYQFETAEGSFDLLVKRCADNFQPHFERVSYQVSVDAGIEGAATTKAVVALQVGDEIVHATAGGDGPLHALDAALRKALSLTFPNLAETRLVSYKVAVINSGAGAAANVRVVIESRDERDVWRTVSVNKDIIEASWGALVDSIEYKLHKDQAERQGPAHANARPEAPETCGRHSPRQGSVDSTVMSIDAAAVGGIRSPTGSILR